MVYFFQAICKKPLYFKILKGNIAIIKLIIIVDDEPDVVELFRDALESHGYGVDTFTDPLEAVAHIKKNPEQYNLLITDYRMPHLNGYEFALRIKELNKKMRLFLLVHITILKTIKDNSNYLKNQFQYKL
jgi:CheY-like chemotaxis protein